MWCASMADPLPGDVWWCDGIALEFEWRFKRRPVVVVEATGDQIVVLPLSHRRHLGQEPEVRHPGGVSYLAGGPRTVPADALRVRIGCWEGYAAWRVEAEAIAEAASKPLWDQLQRRIRRWFLG